MRQSDFACKKTLSVDYGKKRSKWKFTVRAINRHMQMTKTTGNAQHHFHEYGYGDRMIH